MELWPAPSTILLLITLLLPARKAESFQVSQEPRSINATVNGTINVSCYFVTNTQSRPQVTWLWGPEDGVKLEVHHPFYHGRLRTTLVAHRGQAQARMELSAVEERDSGRYYCCIEMYQGQSLQGEGTLLSVMQREEGKKGEPTAEISASCYGSPSTDTEDNRKGEGQCTCPDGRTEVTAYRAVVVLGAPIFLTVTILLLLQKHRATAAKTREQQLTQADDQVSSKRSGHMHGVEINRTSRQGAACVPIWNKPQENTKYAPLQTRPL